MLLKDVQGGKTPKVLVLRLDVGPVEKTGDLPALRPKLTHRNRGVGRTADMEHHAPCRHAGSAPSREGRWTPPLNVSPSQLLKRSKASAMPSALSPIAT